MQFDILSVKRMDARQHKLKIRWDDPQLREKALQFFLDVYREQREDQQRRLRTEQRAEADGDTNQDGQPDWHLGLDNLPEEYLSKEHFLWLHEVSEGIGRLLNQPLPDVTDGRTAAFLLMTYRILGEARRFILAVFYFLMFDMRIHKDAPLRVNAVGVLGIGETKEEEQKFYAITFSLCLSQKVYDILWHPQPSDASFTDAISILRRCGELYFTTLESIFPVCAIGKCHRAFKLFMDKIGTTAMEERVKNYVRRRKTMQREIERWVQRNEGDTRPQKPIASAVSSDDLIQLTQEVLAAIERSTRTIDNMDRRQRDLFKYVKRVIAGFIRLFRPLKPKPTPEQLTNALLPPDRYVCLANVKEPHRTQIKAVIDHTYRHPIVYEQKRPGDYSLAQAVRDVWLEKHNTWSFAEGTFATVDDLKSACYNMRKGDHDPFHYQA